MTDASAPGHELTEAEKRENVVRLAFDGDAAKLDRFVEIIREYLPADTGVVLRGSAVTGFRWKDGAPFDSEGPGTSDLDLTLVGAAILDYYKVTGFFVPGVHSRPLSDDIALPSSRYSPDVGRSSSPMTFISVLLPEPEGPRIATNSPAPIRSDTRSSAFTGGSPGFW